MKKLGSGSYIFRTVPVPKKHGTTVPVVEKINSGFGSRNQTDSGQRSLE